MFKADNKNTRTTSFGSVSQKRYTLKDVCWYFKSCGEFWWWFCMEERYMLHGRPWGYKINIWIMLKLNKRVAQCSYSITRVKWDVSLKQKDVSSNLRGCSSLILNILLFSVPATVIFAADKYIFNPIMTPTDSNRIWTQMIG